MTSKQFRYFLFTHLPIAWMAGLRLLNLTNSKSEIGIQLGRWTKNPFKSIFWAVQGMAAELSTGILIVSKLKQRRIKVSMLVTEVQGSFFKKAKGKIRFTCVQGEELDNVLSSLKNYGDTAVWMAKSSGLDEEGEEVSGFQFRWSFKKR